jgi:hypothetical protein
VLGNHCTSGNNLLSLNPKWGTLPIGVCLIFMNWCSFTKNSFSSGLALTLLLRRGWTKLLQRRPFLPPPLPAGLLYKNMHKWINQGKKSACGEWCHKYKFVTHAFIARWLVNSAREIDFIYRSTFRSPVLVLTKLRYKPTSHCSLKINCWSAQITQ